MAILDISLWVFVSMTAFGVCLSLPVPKYKPRITEYDMLDVGLLLTGFGSLGAVACCIVYTGIWFVNLVEGLFSCVS